MIVMYFTFKCQAVKNTVKNSTRTQKKSKPNTQRLILQVFWLSYFAWRFLDLRLGDVRVWPPGQSRSCLNVEQKTCVPSPRARRKLNPRRNVSPREKPKPRALLRRCRKKQRRVRQDNANSRKNKRWRVRQDASSRPTMGMFTQGSTTVRSRREPLWTRLAYQAFFCIPKFHASK